MNERLTIHLRIVSTQDGLEALSALANQEIRFSQMRTTKDSTTSEFGLTQLAEVVTVVGGLAGLAQLAVSIASAMDKKRTYRVQGPRRTVVIRAGETVDPQAIEKLLKAAIGVVE